MPGKACFGCWPLQPDRVRILRDVKLQMALGKLKRFLQSWRFNTVRPVRCLIDDGSSSMKVPSRWSSNKFVMSVSISGNFLSFEQPDRFNRISCLRPPTDGCNSCKLGQPWKISLSIFGNPVKSGVRIKYSELLKSMSFNQSKFCDKTISKYRN